MSSGVSLTILGKNGIQFEWSLATYAHNLDKYHFLFVSSLGDFSEIPVQVQSWWDISCLNRWFCILSLSYCFIADIRNGNGYGEGYGQIDESQVVRYTKEALTQLLNLVDSKLSARYEISMFKPELCPLHGVPIGTCHSILHHSV